MSKRPQPPPPVTQSVASGEDHNFAVSLAKGGSAFASVELPSGAKIDKVDGFVWRAKILIGPAGEKYPAFIQEVAKPS